MPEFDDKYILKTINLSRSFGGLTALAGIDLHIKYRTIMGLIGPNGAVKPLFNVLTGHYQLTTSQIYLNLSKYQFKPTRSPRREFRAFQNIRLFNQMSVLDSAHRTPLPDSYRWGACCASIKHREENIPEAALNLLTFVNIQDKRNEWAANCLANNAAWK